MGGGPPGLARENPFAAERAVRIRCRVPGGLDGMLARLEERGGRGAIVGPKGHGKTTLLEEAGRTLEARGRRVRLLRLSSDAPRLDPGGLRRLRRETGAPDAVLLDGAEQLSWLSWRRFLRATRAAGTVVVTTHRPGRLPTLLACRTSPDLLREIADELLGGSRRLPEPLALELHRRHGGNLREALRELYDLWAERGPGFLTPGRGVLASGPPAFRFAPGGFRI